MKALRSILLPVLVVSVTLGVLWYARLPAPPVASSIEQVQQEAERGGYRLIDVDTLWHLYRSNRENMLLVDTRQAWEHRAGYIDGSALFSVEPTWWDRRHKKRALKAFLGSDKQKTIVFY